MPAALERFHCPMPPLSPRSADKSFLVLFFKKELLSCAFKYSAESSHKEFKMKYETLLIETIDHVAVVTLNPPNKRNAMSPRLHEDMKDALVRLRYDADVRVVVITGAGPAFCAGMDLKEFFKDLGDDPAEFDRIFQIATEWRGQTLRYFPKPTIAMINGYCFGGAFSIVEGCDLAIAAEGDPRPVRNQLQTFSWR